MTLAEPLDPYGFWQAPPAGRAVSFGVPGAQEEVPAAVWALELGSAVGAEALAERAARVAAVDAGLDAAAARLDAFLARRAAGARAPGAQSFSLAGAGDPEALLAGALDGWEDPAGAPVAFGLREDLAALAGRARGLNPAQWGELRARLAELVTGLQRQVGHFVWVDTTLDGRLAARTTVAWSGDLSTRAWQGLSAGQLQAHHHSLALACEARAAHLRTLLVAAQMAGKLTLAVTTPLGPLQALALAWQFLQGVVLPRLGEETAPAQTF